MGPAQSPQAVLEATRWLVEVDVSSVRAPAYVVAADRDPLVPARLVESLAAGLRAECRTLADRGHGIPVDPGWDDVIEGAHDWLLRTV